MSRGTKEVPIFFWLFVCSKKKRISLNKKKRFFRRHKSNKTKFRENIKNIDRKWRLVAAFRGSAVLKQVGNLSQLSCARRAGSDTSGCWVQALGRPPPKTMGLDPVFFNRHLRYITETCYTRFLNNTRSATTISKCNRCRLVRKVIFSRTTSSTSHLFEVDQPKVEQKH